MQVKSQFDFFLDKIRPFILDYLKLKGFNTKGAIKCINPAHDDHSPSMLCSNAAQNDWRLFCRSCLFRADIFDVYSILENKPRGGPGWLREVVLPLAMMFNVPPPVSEITTEEQFCYDLYRVYEDIASLIEHDIQKIDGPPKKYIESRQWTRETLEKLDIGVLDYGLIKGVTSDEEREKFGLAREDLFNKENLIFLSRDQFGRPIRFFARRPEGEKPKMISTSSSSLQVDLWRGKGRLYLSHLLDKSSNHVVLVEGQGDAVSLYQAKINVAGAYGATFTEAHSDALLLSGVTKITICLDGDETGQQATEKILRKDFAKSGGITYEVAKLPDGYDPDSYLREFGEQKLRYLLNELKTSAFGYLLSLQRKTSNAEEICAELIPYIAASKSEISREKMARELVSFLDGEVSIGAVLGDVRRLDASAATALLERQKSIVKVAFRQADQDIHQAKEIFRDAIERLDEADKSSTIGINFRNNCLAKLQACKSLEETRLSGAYTLLPGRLGSFGDMLAGGDWISGRVILIAAIENMGKSSFLDSMVWEIISNPDNNAIAYILSIDDSAESRFRRIMCNIIGCPDFTQNMIADPHHFAEDLGIANIYERREMAYAKFTELIASGKLIIEDERDGKSVSYLDKRVAQIRRDNPTKNLFVGLDNLHDCDDFAGSEERDRMSRIIKYVRRVARIHKCSIAATAEYRKLNGERQGTDEDLASSAKLKYAPHLTIHLFSDTNYKGEDDAVLVHEYQGELFPRVVATIGKNKITQLKGKKNRLFFDFFPAASIFKSVPREQGIKEQKTRKEELAKQSNQPQQSEQIDDED